MESNWIPEWNSHSHSQMQGNFEFWQRYKCTNKILQAKATTWKSTTSQEWSELIGKISKYIGSYEENKAKNLIKYINKEPSADEMRTRGATNTKLNFLDIQNMLTLIHNLVRRLGDSKSAAG